MGKKVYKAKYSGKVYNTAHEAAVDNANYLRARKLTEQTNRIPATYIGGTPQEARAEYWRQEPVMQHAVDSIAGRYGIDPAVLKHRLDKEGFTDSQIDLRNLMIETGRSDAIPPRGYEILNRSHQRGITFGLDDAKDYIESGKVKLINENWGDTDDFENEKGRTTHPVQGDTVGDNIGIVAAHLKYFRDKAREDFPNASEEDLNRYAQAYFNRGEAGGKKWVESGAKGYNYKAYGGSKDSPWNNLSMADKAVMMEVAIRNGITTLPEIREAYNEFAKGGNLYPDGGTKKQTFLSSLDQSLKEDNRFDDAQWRQFFTDLANMESGYSPNITNSIGAKGYFQLMPFNRAKTWSNPTQQFHEMYKLTGNNLNYLNKNLTKEDWKKADALGIDMYGMLAGAHLGGAGNVLKALRGKGNAKDMNGTSVMKYMTKFSQKGAVPTLATPTYYEDTPTALFAPSNPEVFFGGYKAPEIEAPLPSLGLDETPQYSEEEIARQERRERLNNLSMLMSLTSPQGSNNSMLDAIGLLMR